MAKIFKAWRRARRARRLAGEVSRLNERYELITAARRLLGSPDKGKAAFARYILGGRRGAIS
jgi:hypothetical protein